ncbi:MAG: type VI secretion system tip protein VgrG [Polyangiaceae bacterium]|nr:type VI secretion system tip protein VgrG [Polyangiaceae bacterium]
MGLHFRLEFEDGSPGELDGPGFTVTEVELWQAMSELFHLAVRFRSPAPHVELRQLLGQRVVAHLLRDDAGHAPEHYLPRVAGIVRHARQLVAGEPGALSTYELVIAPALSLLDLHRGSYIQQRVTAPELVARHFELHNRTSSRKLEPAIDATHGSRRREYVVQYGERNLDHVRRILAEEGIAFYFAGDALRDLKLVSDTTEDRAAAEGIRLPYRPASDALLHDDDVVLEVETGPALRPTHELLRDYHFDNPQFRAEGAASTVPVPGEESLDYVYEEGALHVFDPATKLDRLMEDADRTRRAHERLQAQRRDHAVVTCRTSCPLPVGGVLTVTGEHPMADTELTIVESTTLLRYAEDATGGRVTRLHRARSIPASFPFRPRHLPKPRIHGVQRATVIGPEHINVDEHGRVVLMFYWDVAGDGITEARGTNLQLTRRVPVAQSWAGSGHGFLAVPRAGDEVLVAYVDGDPDEPVVVGRVYHGTNRVAVALPRDRTQSLWRTESSPEATGFHEIRFEDANGREELHVEAERLYTRKVKGSESTAVGGSRSLVVGGDQSVRIGGDFVTHVAGMRYTKSADDFLVSDGAADVTCGTRAENTTGKHSMHAGTMRIQVDGALAAEAGSVTIEASTITLRAGGSSIEITDGAITIKAGTVSIN